MKPAARVGDSVADGVIVSGSPTVLIGDAGSGNGQACSTCPDSQAVGNPVNPALGAKVQSGDRELDFALPGALPVVWQRQYSSYVNREHGPRLGVLGFGWTLPFEVRAQLDERACRLFDSSGRVITFDPLAPGATLYSPSEDLWLLRGGLELPQRLADAIETAASQQGLATPTQPESIAYAARWRALSTFNREQLADPGRLFATSGSALWVFQQRGLGRYELDRLVDRYGRCQHYRWADGRLTELQDGVGRRYRLRYDSVHTGRKASSPWPADSGLRLMGVDLVADPLFADTDFAVKTLVTYRYSPEGDLISVIDRHGEEVRRFAYRQHSLVFHRYRQGPEHRYVYESDQPGARVLEQHNQEGLSYRFDYLDSENAVLVTDSLGRIDRYQFQGTGGLKRLVEHTRPDGSQLRYDYDAAGRQVSRTDALGRSTYTRLDGEGRLLGIQTPDGASLTHRHDARGQLIESSSAAGRRTRYTYDPWGRLTEVEAADGSQTRYQYPDPKSEAVLTCEHPIGIIDAQGGHKTLAWNRVGQLTAYTDCSGRTTRYQYDRWGELTETTNPLGQVTRYERDRQGRLASLVQADGSLSRYRYEQDRLVEEVDPLGRVTAYGYDLWGRLKHRQQGGTTLGLAYDIAGRLTTLTNENGAQTRFSYDALDRLTREVGFDQRAQDYHYDAASRLLQTQDGNPAQVRQTTYAYDLADRLIERRIAHTEAASGEVHRFTYDRDGLLLKATVLVLPRTASEAADAPLPRSSEVEIERDVLGRPVCETQRLYAEVTEGSALAVSDTPLFEYALRHRYSVLGHRTASDAGLGELDWLTYGAGHVHGLTLERQTLLDLDRDAGHREIARRLANGLHETRQLDPLGRLLHQGFSLAPVPGLPQGAAFGTAQGEVHSVLPERRYAYDAAGQLLGMRTADRTLSYAYDPQGRLVSHREARPGGRPAAEVRYRFDPAGNRLPEPLPDSARPEDWGQRVRANLPDPGFNVIDQEATSVPLPEVRLWPENRVGHHAGVRYAYDAWGNRVEAKLPDQSRIRYAYDGLHRLVRLTTPEADIRYRYDAFGRRLAKQVLRSGKTQTTWFGWDGDRLTRIEDEATTRETVYEPASFVPLLMLEQAKGGPSATEALFDAMAADASARTALALMPKEMRATLEQHVQAAARAGLPAQARSVLPEGFDTRAADQALQATRETLARDTPPTRVRYFHCDHLGTPMALSDEEGKIVWSARFDPWGNLIEEQVDDGVMQPFRFQGQFFDEESGLHYNRHRYYDPKLGTYVTQDPIGLNGGPHAYRYPHNPMTWVDPKGLQVSGNGYPSLRSYGEGIWNEAENRINKFISPVTEFISPVTEYCNSVVDRFKEGGTGEATAGGTAVVGAGIKSTVGAAIDTTGRSCVTTSTCLVVGPMIGNYVNAGGSVSSGTVTPGGDIWQFGLTGSAVAGVGGEGGVMLGSDGSLEGGLEGSMGGGIGAALLVCKKKTTTKCNAE